MAIRSKDEIMTAIRARIGDDTSDEALSLIEDVNDTITDYDTRVADQTDWKAKYTENDESWRKRYRDRFFGIDETPGNTTTTPATVVGDNASDLKGESEDKTFDELFEEKGENSGY